MQTIKIETVTMRYEFTVTGFGDGILYGGRIMDSEGVRGFFEEEPVVGSTPVFITTEPCTLIYDGVEVEVGALGGMRLAEIVSVVVVE